MQVRRALLAAGRAVGLVSLTLGLAGVALGLAGRFGAPPAHAGGQEDPGPVDSSGGPVVTSVPVDSAPTGTTEPGSQTTLPGQHPTATTLTTVAGITNPTLPPGCQPPPAPRVVFVGLLVLSTGQAGRFRVDAVRADPEKIVEIGRYLDVELGTDLRFLAIGQEYLVAAEAAPAAGPVGSSTAVSAATPAAGAVGLTSKVQRPPPLFGGDEVVGVNDPAVRCPELVDPIVVRRADGGSVDTGVFSGFLHDKRHIGTAFLKPAAAVVGLLVGLVVLKYVLIGIGKGVLSLVRRLRRWRDARAERRAPAATLGS